MSKAIEVDTKTFVRFWLVMIGFALLALILSRAKTALILIGIAIFLAIALKPLANKLDKVSKKKARPGLAAGVTVGGIVAIFLVAVATVGPMVITETSRFLSTAPEQVQSAISGWDGLNKFGAMFGINNTQAQLVSMLKDFSQSILSNMPETVVNSLGTLANFLTGAVLVIVLTILFMTQGPKLYHGIMSKIMAKNEKASKLAERITTQMAGVISKYVTGQLVVAMLDGIVTGVVVFIISLIFGLSAGLAFPMALIAAIFFMIPMFGPVITAVVVTLLLFFSNPWAGLAFLVFYVIWEQIENNVISPRVQGNSLSLPPLVILIAVTLGMYMYGLVGAIISIPIAGIIKVLVDEYPNIKALHE